MLDHLTKGRLEVGTASGIPPEMALVGLGVPEANARNAEAQDILDWALTHPGQPISHHGKFWNFRQSDGGSDHAAATFAAALDDGRYRRVGATFGSPRHQDLYRLFLGGGRNESVRWLPRGGRPSRIRGNSDSLGLRRVVNIALDEARRAPFRRGCTNRFAPFFSNPMIVLITARAGRSAEGAWRDAALVR